MRHRSADSLFGSPASVVRADRPFQLAIGPPILDRLFVRPANPPSTDLKPSRRPPARPADALPAVYNPQ